MFSRPYSGEPNPHPWEFCGWLLPVNVQGEVLPLATHLEARIKHPVWWIYTPFEEGEKKQTFVSNVLHALSVPSYTTSSHIPLPGGVNYSLSPSPKDCPKPSGIRFRQVHKHCIYHSGPVWPMAFQATLWELGTEQGLFSLDPPLLIQGCLAGPSTPRGKCSGQE